MKKIFSTRLSENAVAMGLLLLRAGFGIAMASHGFQKLQNFSDTRGKLPDPFHFGPSVNLSMLIFAEFFCAIFIVLGLFTRLAAIPLIIAMSVALFMAHHGKYIGEGEMAGIYLVAFFSILVMGPGKYSVDRLIGK